MNWLSTPALNKKSAPTPVPITSNNKFVFYVQVCYQR
jgi:hypothetical protein